MKPRIFLVGLMLALAVLVWRASAQLKPVNAPSATISGSITGAYSFAAGIVTVDATNVYLVPGISNLMANLPVTNETSTALQINTGVISLSPGVVSNIVASGFGSPYIAINTNSGTLNNVTSLVFRTSNVTISNDAAGIASIHIISAIPIQNGRANSLISTSSTFVGTTVLSGLAGQFLYASSGLEELTAGTFGNGLTFDSGTVNVNSNGVALAIRGATLVGTNLWLTGTVAQVSTNYLEANSSGVGVTNFLISDLPQGKYYRHYFWASNGVLPNFPQFTATQYVPDGSVVTANTNCMSYVEFFRFGTETNITIGTAELTFQPGNFTEAVTNYATRTVTYQNTTRKTNYAQAAAITINAATDVRASISNAYAQASGTITLATPVLEAVGSLTLVSDATARTIAVLCPSSTISWMSTNYTASGTNILTTASKRSVFYWKNQLATDGSTTNTVCWVINQF